MRHMHSLIREVGRLCGHVSPENGLPRFANNLRCAGAVIIAISSEKEANWPSTRNLLQGRNQGVTVLAALGVNHDNPIRPDLHRNVPVRPLQHIDAVLEGYQTLLASHLGKRPKGHQVEHAIGFRMEVEVF
jgi:hypothetical protein